MIVLGDEKTLVTRVETTEMRQQSKEHEIEEVCNDSANSSVRRNIKIQDASTGM